jgi:hypothetical protein
MTTTTLHTEQTRATSVAAVELEQVSKRFGAAWTWPDGTTSGQPRTGSWSRTPRPPARHLSAAIGKTGARTRAEAIRRAEENGWLLA